MALLTLLPTLLWGLLIPALQPSAPSLQLQRNDIIISEIMADPSPPLGLPNAEYIEIRNRSGRPISLAGWRFYAGNTASGAFPAYTLPADSMLLLTTSANASSLAPFGKVLAVPGFPSLPNEGALIALLSKEGAWIHALSFSKAWFDNSVKSEGGWSLEMIDPNNPCAGRSNWAACTDPRGGTPGRRNSVEAANPDKVAPRLLRAYATDSLSIYTVFDEPLDSLTAARLSNYTLSHGVSIRNVNPLPPLYDAVLVKVDQPLDKGKVYNLTVSGLTDCGGNPIGASNGAKVGLAEEASLSDLVINEILANPRPLQPDYIEVYNRSRKVVDARWLYLANRTGSGALGVPRRLSENPFPLFPGDYVVLTGDSAGLQKGYLVKAPSQVLNLSSFPTFPDDKGNVVLLNAAGKLVDEVGYSARWHFPLIQDPSGVALERIDPEGPSNDGNNWHSAASSAGFGTPTYRNSQYKQPASGEATIEVTPKVFSPNNDGLEDVAFLSYNLTASGYVANVTIFDAAGRPLRYLVKNALLGLKGQWSWDGMDEKRQPAPAGTYIFYTEIFGLNGQQKGYKNTVVLTRPLQ